MKPSKRPIRHIGGRTCLDFVNTANWSPDGDLVEEKLETDEDVEIWCRDAGLRTVAGKQGRLPEIVRFRGSLRRVLLAAMNDVAPGKEDLAALNSALESLPRQVMEPGDGRGIGLNPSLTLDQAAAVSAMALLSRGSEIGRVKVCPGDNCAWMFLDESKNRRRTWCSMDACGNRAKAKRHYRRKSNKAG
jgi:predicted RNA-binding Zn ribbon-like protein